VFLLIRKLRGLNKISLTPFFRDPALITTSSQAAGTRSFLQPLTSPGARTEQQNQSAAEGSLILVSQTACLQ
jgi:hypothetical protein